MKIVFSGSIVSRFASRVWDCTLFLAFASLLAYDNKTKSYYVQVGSWWLGSGVASGRGVFALLGASSVLPLMMHQLMFVYSVCIYICFFFTL